MDNSLELMIVVGRRRFTSGHLTVEGEEEDRNIYGRTKRWTSWEVILSQSRDHAVYGVKIWIRTTGCDTDSIPDGEAILGQCM